MKKVKALAAPTTRLSIPASWLNKVSVGQVITVGQYPKQENYEILYIHRPDLWVNVRRKNN